MKPTALNGGHTKLPVVGYKGASSSMIIQFKVLQNVGVQRLLVRGRDDQFYIFATYWHFLKKD